MVRGDPLASLEAEVEELKRQIVTLTNEKKKEKAARATSVAVWKEEFTTEVNKSDPRHHMTQHGFF